MSWGEQQSGEERVEEEFEGFFWGGKVGSLGVRGILVAVAAGAVLGIRSRVIGFGSTCLDSHRTGNGKSIRTQNMTLRAS